jgi:MFS family permease
MSGRVCYDFASLSLFSNTLSSNVVSRDGRDAAMLTDMAVFLYAILNIGTALADNFPMLVIFCFLIGVAGSVALNNVAGTISDLFGVCGLASLPFSSPCPWNIHT